MPGPTTPGYPRGPLPRALILPPPPGQPRTVQQDQRVRYGTMTSPASAVEGRKGRRKAPVGSLPARAQVAERAARAEAQGVPEHLRCSPPVPVQPTTLTQPTEAEARAQRQHKPPLPRYSRAERYVAAFLERVGAVYCYQDNTVLVDGHRRTPDWISTQTCVHSRKEMVSVYDGVVLWITERRVEIERAAAARLAALGGDRNTRLAAARELVVDGPLRPCLGVVWRGRRKYPTPLPESPECYAEWLVDWIEAVRGRLAQRWRPASVVIPLPVVVAPMRPVAARALMAALLAPVKDLVLEVRAAAASKAWSAPRINPILLGAPLVWVADTHELKGTAQASLLEGVLSRRMRWARLMPMAHDAQVIVSATDDVPPQAFTAVAKATPDRQIVPLQWGSQWEGAAVAAGKEAPALELVQRLWGGCVDFA